MSLPKPVEPAARAVAAVVGVDSLSSELLKPATFGSRVGSLDAGRVTMKTSR